MNIKQLLDTKRYIIAHETITDSSVAYSSVRPIDYSNRELRFKNGKLYLDVFFVDEIRAEGETLLYKVTV